VTAPTRRRSLPPLRSGPDAADVRRRPSLLRLFTVGASALTLLGIVAVALGATALAALGGARGDLLDGAVPAVDAGQRLSIALLDQETGVRGFGLTGREEFLDPYRAGRQSEDEAVAELQAGGTPVPDVGAVRDAAQRWREQYAEPAIAATCDANPLAVGGEVEEQLAGGVVEDLRANRHAQDDVAPGFPAPTPSPTASCSTRSGSAPTSWWTGCRPTRRPRAAPSPPPRRSCASPRSASPPCC